MSGSALLWLLLAVPGWGDLACSSLWDQGKAEVALYRVEGRREGAARSYEAVTVLVKENFDPDRLVKAGAGAKRTEQILKFNHEITVPTGIYTYRQMASVFLRRSDLKILKLAVSSQELCGTTSKLWRSDLPTRLRTQSYFDGEGDRDHRLDYQAGTWFYDALPVLLRTQAPQAKPLRVRLVPPQISNRAPAPEVAEAWIRWKDSEQLRTSLGEIKVRRVVVSHAGGEDSFFIQEDSPHLLVRWEQADGTTYRLHNVLRIPYWRHTRDGDRKLLEDLPPKAGDQD